MKKHWYRIALSLVIIINLPIYYFMLHPIFRIMVYEHKQEKAQQRTVEKFLNLPVSEHERLIEISKKLHEEEYRFPYHHKSYTTDAASISNGFAKQLPSEFVDFGIHDASLSTNDSLRGHLCYSYGHEAWVVVDWSDPNQSTIQVEQDDPEVFIIPVYPK